MSCTTELHFSTCCLHDPGSWSQDSTRAVEGRKRYVRHRILVGPLNVYLEIGQRVLTEEKFLLISVLCTLAVPRDASKVLSRPVHTVRMGIVA